MRIRYDTEVDILDIYLSGASRHTSKEIAPGIIADLDEAGGSISLEILDASERYSAEYLANFSFERVPSR